MQLEQFIHASNQSEKLEDLLSSFCEVLEKAGFDTYCNFSTDKLVLDSESPIASTRKLHYNEPFVTQYLERNYIEFDPVFKLFWQARGPFNWEQVKQLPLSKKQLEIMDFRKEAGFRCGIAIPIRSADPKMIGICVQSSRDNVDLGKVAVNQLFAVCNQFHLQRARIMIKEHPLALPDVTLTPREKEIMSWCAQGKSNGVIATILGISEKTVEFHFQSIYTKLQTNNRTTAVLKALHLKILHMDPAHSTGVHKVING